MAMAIGARVGLSLCIGACAFGCSDGYPSDPMNGMAGSGGAAESMSGSSNQAGTPPTAGGGGGGASAGMGGATGGAGGISGGMGGASGGAGGSPIDPNGGAPAGPASSRHRQVPRGTMSGTTAGYWEYLPPHYGNGALYPVLIFRHGVGENGNGTTDLAKVAVHGPPKLIQANQWPDERKFVVLSVQHTGEGCPSADEIDDFIGFALDNYDIDPKRVYLTGLSCGAIGSWDYLGEHTNEDVAAAVLVCGDGRSAFEKAKCNLGKVPIWAFHGEKDESVDLEGSTEPVAGLMACTNPAPVDVKLTTYPNVGHDSWTMTYDVSVPERDIYAWLMTHQK
jgi:poly(3-hydroxybutyrate) depolymerase